MTIEFFLNEEILQYSTNCYFSSLTNKSISIITLYPAVFFKKWWGNSMIGGDQFFLTLDEVPMSQDYRAFKEKKENFPVYVSPFETIKFRALFAVPIGKMFVDGECRSNHRFKHWKRGSPQPITRASVCFENPPEKVQWVKALENEIHYAFQQFDRFGMVLILSTGQKVNLEADFRQYHLCEGSRDDIDECTRKRFSKPEIWEGDWVYSLEDYLPSKRFSFGAFLLFAVFLIIRILMQFFAMLRTKS